MNTIKGTIKVVKDTVQVSEKFSKQEFVVTTEETYPQDIILQVTQDKCGSVPNVGTKVEVSYNLKGREWTNPQGEIKYFNTIEAWKIATVGSEAKAEELERPVAPPIQDDLPF